MCGIAGLVGAGTEKLERRVLAMVDALRHRGPDGDGVWCDEAAGVALGHARLAIRDLSPSGAQPMLSASGRFVLTYNGELYNAEELKAALPGHPWRGTSDSEALLEYAAAFGIEAALRAANGMFAFALWDKRERRLHLARDRFGIKPLYWAQSGQAFLFASELRALERDPAFERRLDEIALGAYARLGYVPDPLSIWQTAHKLGPGCLLTLKQGEAPTIGHWWNAIDDLKAGILRQGGVSQDALQEEASALLADAISRQTVSDVPVGVFLSGGIDSSAVAAHLSGVQSFTIGFDEAGYDESQQAANIARELHLPHHAKRLTYADALEMVPKLADIYDEPFADSSQIPTCLLARFAKERVKVALSGDGGDEIFAGYNRHRFAQIWQPRLAALPQGVRRLLAASLGLLSVGGWDQLGRLAGQKLAGEKIQKLAAVLPLSSEREIYACLAGQGLSDQESPLAIQGLSPYFVNPFPPLDADLSRLDRMQLLDIRHYLPGDILTKTDRASMAVGLEVRVPLLDHRLLPLAFALSPEARFTGSQGKTLLRRALARRLPAPLFEGRPKQGFAVPIDEWLKGPLKDWAFALIERAKSGGLFDAKRLDVWWTQHQTGTRKRHHALWNILMFQAWREGR